MSAVAAERGPPPPKLALFALGLGFVVLALDSLMVAGAGPTIAGELHGVELLGWLFTGALLMWTCTGPLFGKLADVYGRRPILLVGLGVFSVGALIASQAQTMEQLIAARLVQGVGSAGVQSACYTAGADLYPPPERAKAQVLFSVVYLLGSLVAPPLTGVLIAEVSWRAIFLVTVALGVTASICVWLALPEHVERQEHRLDLAGAAALIVGGGSLMLALAQGGRQGDWGAPSQLALYALGVIGTATFLWLESRAPEPLVPLKMFHNRIILGACVVILAMGAGLWSYSAFVPLLVQGVLGRSPFEASLVALPSNTAWLVTNILAVPLIWQWGYRVICLMGMILLALGFVILAFVGQDVPLAYEVVLLGMTIVGSGLGFVNTAAIVAVQNAVPWGERGTATAAGQFCRSFGPTMFISVLQALLNGQVVAQLVARGVAVDQLATGASRTGQANALLAPELRAALSPAVLENLREALEVSLHQTFGLVAAVVALGCLAVWLLPGGHPEAHVWREQGAAARE